jgi:hypothetical protein
MANSGITRNGKPVQVGDQVSIVGVVTAVTGTGEAANLTVLCSGALTGPGISGTPGGVYSYSIGVPLGGGTNPPATGVYAADVAASQSL